MAAPIATRSVALGDGARRVQGLLVRVTELLPGRPEGRVSRRARGQSCSNAEKTVVTLRMVRCRASFGQREEAMLKRIFALALGLALGAPVLAADSISATHVFRHLSSTRAAFSNL